MNSDQIPEAEIKRIEIASGEAGRNAGHLSMSRAALAQYFYQVGAKAEYLRHLSPSLTSNPGPRWVKASERPPGNDPLKDICVKSKGVYETARFYDDKFHVFVPPMKSWRPFITSVDQLEWLSEDPAPQVEEKGMREWTPIAEGLPEANAECWVVIDGPKGSYVTEAHLIKDGQGNTLFTEWRDAEGWNFVFDITHWMLKIRPALPSSSLPLPTDKK